MNSINHPRLGIKLYYWAYRNICVRVISYFPVSMGGCITSNFLTATWWTFELRSLHPPNAWSCQIEGQKLTSLYTVFGFQVAKIQLRLGPLESANKPSWCQLQSFDWLGLHSRLNNLQLSKNRSNKLWPFCGQHAMWQGWESSKLDKQRSINLSIRHGSNMLLLSGAPTPVVLSQLGKVGEDRLNLQLVQLQHPSRHRLNLTNMWCHDDPLTAFQVTQVLFVHNPFEDWRWVFIHFVLCTSHNLLGPHLIRWFVQENSNLKPNRGHSPNTKKGIHFPHYEAAGNGWPVEGWRCCLANAVWHFLYHHKLDTSSALGENSLGHFIHVGSCRHPFRPTPHPQHHQHHHPQKQKSSGLQEPFPPPCCDPSQDWLGAGLGVGSHSTMKWPGFNGLWQVMPMPAMADAEKEAGWSENPEPEISAVSRMVKRMLMISSCKIWELDMQSWWHRSAHGMMEMPVRHHRNFRRNHHLLLQWLGCGKSMEIPHDPLNIGVKSAILRYYD